MTDTRPEKRSLFLFPFIVIIYTQNRYQCRRITMLTLEKIDDKTDIMTM